MHIQTDPDGHNRVFVDITKPGCSCYCSYCYVKRVGDEELIPQAVLARIAEDLRETIGFTPGRYGTLITLGTHSDLCSKTELQEALVKTLASIIELGNPIQFATKYPVSAELAFALARMQRFESQVVVFVSSPFARAAKKLEPKVPAPRERFSSFVALNTFEVANCLLIKPFIPAFTDEDFGDFVDLIRVFRPKAVCVGSFYVTTEIQQRMGVPQEADVSAQMHHPLSPGMNRVLLPSARFIEDLRNSCPGLKVFLSSPCAVGFLQHRACPTRVWSQYPQLCIGQQNCQNCEVLELKQR